jgi:hypothetical protein
MICPVLLLGAGGQMPLSQGEHRRCRAFVPLFQLSFVVLHSKLGQGKLAMGNAKNSGESVYIDRDGRQKGTSEQRIRLVIPRLSLGHESSESPEFSAEWMLIKEKQALQKLSEAVYVRVGNRL